MDLDINALISKQIKVIIIISGHNRILVPSLQLSSFGSHFTTTDEHNKQTTPDHTDLSF